MAAEQKPSVLLQSPLTQKRSPHSRSVVHDLGTQMAPAGLMTQVKPPAQGTVPQRTSSQRFVFALHT